MMERGDGTDGGCLMMDVGLVRHNIKHTVDIGIRKAGQRECRNYGICEAHTATLVQVVSSALLSLRLLNRVRVAA